MSTGKASVSFKVRGEATVFLQRKKGLEPNSKQIAELAICVEETEVSARLDKEELKNLVAEAQRLIDEAP
jgi:hypothetical protein